MEPEDSVTCPLLIGRESAIARFDQAFESVRQGAGRAITIAGEAGVGKSRLAAALAGRAQDSDGNARVLTGSCFDHDANVPFAPVIDLWRSYAIRSSDDALRAAFGEHAAGAAALLPELRPAAMRKAGAASASDEERHVLFRALLQPLVDMARAGPLLVIFEDLHWSDETSLDFMLLLARRVQELPVALVLTYRADEVGPALAHFLSELERGRLSLELALDRLPPADVSRMVHAILGANVLPQPDMVGAVYELTDGNPFFVEEVLKSMSALPDGTAQPPGTADASAWTGLRIPRSVQDAVRERSGRLTPEAQRLLVHAAVAGRRFELALLARLIGAGEGEVVALIKELIAAQLVAEESEDRFAFRHALTQQAIYSSLLRRERSALHREIAAMIEEMCTDDADPRLADLAHHYFEAGDAQRAFEYSWRAGELAQKLFSPRAAAQHFTRAIESAARADRPVPGRIFSARGRAHDALGDFSHASADHEAAMRIARATSDVTGEWQALIDLGFLWATRDYDRAGDLFRRTLDLARAGDDQAMLARSLNRFGNWLVNVGRADEGIEHHQTALRIFVETGDAQGEAETHDLLGMAYGQNGAIAACIDEYTRAIGLLAQLGDEQRLMSALSSRTTYGSPHVCETLPPSGRSIDDVRRDGETALRLAQKSGSAVGAAYAHWTLASAVGTFGLLGEGIALAEEGLRIATEVGHEQWMAGAYYTLGHLHWLALDHGEAIGRLEAGHAIAGRLKSAWWIGNTTAYLALARLSSGDTARARALLDAAPFRPDDAQTVPARRVAWARAELLIAERRPAEALQLARLLLETGAPATSERKPAALVVTAARAHLALGSTAEAAALIDHAVASAEAVGDLPWLWRARCAEAETHLRAGRLDDARRACEHARAVAARLAASLDADGRARFAAAADAYLPQVRPPSARAAARQAADGLTEREREIAGLITLGRTNREIAESLVLSERTVETHVGHILGKLGFSSRAQIAAWSVERGIEAGASAIVS